MKTRLMPATPWHVQTFATELQPEDDVEAQKAGYPGALEACSSILELAVEAWALVESSGRVLAMCAVQPGGRVWVHTAPAFKHAGLGALRHVHHLFRDLLERHARLELDVDPENAELVRLAQWVGFRHQDFVNRDGRTFHHAVLRA